MGPKTHTRKIDEIYKNFERYKVLMHNVLCQNVLMFSLYVLLTKRINTFWSKSNWKFCSGVSRHFGPKKSHMKVQQNSQRILNYIKSSYITFCLKLFWYYQCNITHKRNWHILVWRYWDILSLKILPKKVYEIFFVL